jgi:hypothetical protein
MAPCKVIVDPKANLKGFAAKNRAERRALRAVTLKQERKLIRDAQRRRRQQPRSRGAL